MRMKMSRLVRRDPHLLLYVNTMLTNTGTVFSISGYVTALARRITY